MKVGEGKCLSQGRAAERRQEWSFGPASGVPFDREEGLRVGAALLWALPLPCCATLTQIIPLHLWKVKGELKENPFEEGEMDLEEKRGGWLTAALGSHGGPGLELVSLWEGSGTPGPAPVDIPGTLRLAWREALR